MIHLDFVFNFIYLKVRNHIIYQGHFQLFLHSCCQFVYLNVVTNMHSCIIDIFAVNKSLFDEGLGWLNELGRWIYNSYKPITNTAWVRSQLCKLQKCALDSQPQVIKFTSCLPMVGGSPRELWLPPPLKLVAMIQLKYC